MIPDPVRDSLYRIGAIARHNTIIRRRDPGQMIAYLFMPMILMVVLKPLYIRAVPGGTTQVVTGLLVMFSVFALGIAGNAILVERNWQTWDRLRQTRASSAEMLIGKTIPLFVFMFIPQALLPLAALIYASGIIHDELEEQTFTYLLIRPIPKWAIYLVKLLATATVAVILTAIFTALAYAAIYLGTDSSAHNILLRCATACCIHSLAVIAYCCLFGLISLFTARILIVGIIYIAVVEGLFANLDFGIRLLTVIYYTRLIAYHAMPFLVPPPYGTQDFAAETWQLDIANDPKLLLHPQVITCLIVLLAGSAICAAIAAFLCSRREFHVKTPEKT